MVPVPYSMQTSGPAGSRLGGLQSLGNPPTSFSTQKSSSTSLFRNSKPGASEDALQPLRTMADRVGKEVERFAEALDRWSTHTPDGSNKYRATMQLVSKYKQIADSRVKELRAQHESEDRLHLAADLQKRIDTMRQSTREGSLPDDQVSTTDSTGPSPTVQRLRESQAEAATWELFQIIIELYHKNPSVDREKERNQRLEELGKPYHYTEDAEIWERFLLSDDQAKEKQLILRWLEHTAESTGSDVTAMTEQLMDASKKRKGTWSYGWLETREKLKQAKRMRTWAPAGASDVYNTEGTELLVSELDPDAPTRQIRTLEKPDEFYERALWMAGYEMLRRGKSLAEIRDWFKERNEGWRGVSVGASHEAHAGAPTLMQGPGLGTLWRRMCYAASTAGQNQYERAAYGLLSGNMRSVLPVCRTWDDHLYAHYNSLLLSRFDQYLEINFPSRFPPALARKFPNFNAVQFHGGWESSNKTVIDMLKEDEQTSALSKDPIKLIQGNLIGQTFGDLVYNLGVAISQMAFQGGKESQIIRRIDEPVDQCYTQLANSIEAMRIVTHIYLILKSFGVDFGDEARQSAIENVPTAYMSLLKVGGKTDLLPLYAAQLSKSRSDYVMGRMLPDIQKLEEQKTFMGLMKHNGLDTVDIITEFYEYALQEAAFDHTEPIKRFVMLEPAEKELWPGQRIRKQFLSNEMTAAEELIVQALHWYRLEAAKLSVMTVALAETLKQFLLHGRVEAAIALCEKMPYNEVWEEKTKEKFGKTLEVDDPFRTGSLAEQRKVRSWQTQYRPVIELQQLVRAIEQLHLYREQEDRWIQIQRANGTKPSATEVKEIFDHVQAAIMPLLNDFLTHATDEAESSQFTQIREAYLPEIIIAYNSVIHASARFQSREKYILAMDLATVVARRKNAELASCFVRTGRMPELVEAFANTAKDMVIMGDGDAAKSRSLKRKGSMGETIRVWDINARN